jgi:hypothetical protein
VVIHHGRVAWAKPVEWSPLGKPRAHDGAALLENQWRLKRRGPGSLGRDSDLASQSNQSQAQPNSGSRLVSSRSGPDVISISISRRRKSPHPLESGQRTAVKQRPHQQTVRHQVATNEPVVLHHGREGGGDGHDEARPSASTACWAALVTRAERCAVACFVVRSVS